MSKYLLDFTETPLTPAAGGQLHIVIVGPNPGVRSFDCVQDAICDIIMSHGLAGETETHTPLARVRVTNISDQGSYVEEVQVSAPNEAPDYDPPPRLPTQEEVLAVFPSATDYDQATDGFDLSFVLAIVSVDIQMYNDEEKPYGVSVDWQGHLVTPVARGKDWAALVRTLCATVRSHLQSKAAIFNAADAALEAAIGGAQ
jgi:hypothetical protein